MTDSDRSDFPTPWKCPECGYAFYDDDGWDTWYCSQCGSKMEVSHPSGYVPIGVLEDLVERWERWGQTPKQDEFASGAKHTAENFSQELQEVINDYGDTDE